ncbi:MAG: putative ABC transporter permease [Candidatus Limivivens sp.]|nr:putative ABC transporter permease [Candidatus Limivivens sp.]
MPVELMPWGAPVYGTGTDLYHLVQWFFAYSILGWIVESIYMSFCEKRWVNRGFIFGPICPIYGFGALGVYFLLRPFVGNVFLLYFSGALLATAFEFLVANLMERLFGEVWWDYSGKPFNYRGIICLESTLAWGLYTIVMFYFLHHGIVYVTDLYPKRLGSYLACFLIGYYLVDFGMHVLFARHPGIFRKAERFKGDRCSEQTGSAVDGAMEK